MVSVVPMYECVVLSVVVVVGAIGRGCQWSLLSEEDCHWFPTRRRTCVVGHHCYEADRHGVNQGPGICSLIHQRETIGSSHTALLTPENKISLFARNTWRAP